MNSPRRVCGGSAILALAAALMTGCVHSEPLPPGAMDEAWQTSTSHWDEATTQPLGDEGGKGPCRYEIVYEPSVAWSVIELNRTAERWGESTDTVRFHVSEQHARAIATQFRRLAEQTARMARAMEHGDNPAAQKRWAQASASLVSQVHQLIAAIDPNPDRRTALTIDETAAWVLMPMLEALAGTISGQGRLSQAEQTERLLRSERTILRILLTTSFHLAGRRLPEGALQDVFQVQQTQKPREAEKNTAKLMLWYRHASEQAYDPLGGAAGQAARVADQLAGAMRYLADLSEQWPKVRMLALEIRRYQDRPVVAVEFDIKNGQQVVMRELDFWAPQLIFSGHGRVVVQRADHQPGDRAWTILFQSDNQGGMTLDFDKPVYALVRLLAFPIQTALLREIRYRSFHDDDGRKVHQVEVLLEPASAGQSRQLIRVANREEPLLQDRADLPPQLVGRRESTVFEFLNTQRLWRYERQKTTKPELWKQP